MNFKGVEPQPVGNHQMTIECSSCQYSTELYLPKTAKVHKAKCPVCGLETLHMAEIRPEEDK